MKERSVTKYLIFFLLILVLSGCGGGKSSPATPPVTTIFTDNFDSLSLGDWVVDQSNSITNPNAWSYNSGQPTMAVVDAGSGYGRAIHYQGGSSHFLLNGDSNLTNYTVKAHVRQQGVSPQGIVGRYQSETESYQLYIGDGPPAKTISLWRNNTRIASTDLPFNIDPNTFYLLELVLDGSNIKGYVNGVEYINYTDPSPIVNGRFGIYAHNTEMDFADFQVTQP